MKHIFLAVVATLLLSACATTKNIPIAPTPIPDKCEPVILSVKDVVANKQIFLFVYGDTDCDGLCDKVLVLRYLGKDAKGQDEFELLDALSCEEGDNIYHAMHEKERKA